MKVLGIIAEYNPFHHGHLYHLKKSIEIAKPDFTVAVMSGNFTQRGEAALVDKWIRTETAIKNGIDLVLELPTVYAVQTAERFAYGSIQVLNHTGCVSSLSFGSEIGDINPLIEIAQVLVHEELPFKVLLKEYLNQGLSFPAARLAALLDHLQVPLNVNSDNNKLEQLLKSPNSILAIEYLKTLSVTNSTIEPITITRVHSGYHSQKLKKGISSATAVRKEIFERGLSDELVNALPTATFNTLKTSFENGMGPMSNNSLENLILGLIRRSTADEIEKWVDVNEGLQNRIKECCLRADTLENFLSLLKTKRYVYTRLQRILIHGLLNLSHENFSTFELNGGPQYLRILGFSKNATPLLKLLKETAKVPVITKAAHFSKHSGMVQKMFEYDCLATDLYSLGLKNPAGKMGGRDFTENIRII